jgi:hypothetical protein
MHRFRYLESGRFTDTSRQDKEGESIFVRGLLPAYQAHPSIGRHDGRVRQCPMQLIRDQSFEGGARILGVDHVTTQDDPG